MFVFLFIFLLIIFALFIGDYDNFVLLSVHYFLLYYI